MSRKTQQGCHLAFGRGGGRKADAGLLRRDMLTALPALGWAGRAHASNTAVRLRFDYGDWTGLRDWTQALVRRVDGWWPLMTQALASPGFVAPDEIDVVFITVTPQIAARLTANPLYGRLGVTVSGIAAITRGTTVHVNAPFLLARIDDPDMFGMMAHELAHVVQAYPHGSATWLTEGIADYVRYYVLLPRDPRRAFDRASARYDDGYQATAGFLSWIEQARPGTVRSVNAALRRGQDGSALLERLCGADLEVMWRTYRSPSVSSPAE